MFEIKRLAFIIIIILIGTILINTGYGLWTQNADVKFRLTILKPVDEGACCICDTYETVVEGLDKLDRAFNRRREEMDKYESELRARLRELESLDFPGMTEAERLKEWEYNSGEIERLRNCVTNLRQCCINTLWQIYHTELTVDERAEIPDFDARYNGLEAVYRELYAKSDTLREIAYKIWEYSGRKIIPES